MYPLRIGTSTNIKNTECIIIPTKPPNNKPQWIKFAKTNLAISLRHTDMSFFNLFSPVGLHSPDKHSVPFEHASLSPFFARHLFPTHDPEAQSSAATYEQPHTSPSLTITKPIASTKTYAAFSVGKLLLWHTLVQNIPDPETFRRGLASSTLAVITLLAAFVVRFQRPAFPTQTCAARTVLDTKNPSN